MKPTKTPRTAKGRAVTHMILRPTPTPGHETHQRLDQPPTNRVPILRQVLSRGQRQVVGVHVHRKIPTPRHLQRRA